MNAFFFWSEEILFAVIGFDYGNNCNQHISRTYTKMKVWNLDVIWQCWSYLQICVFVSNIGSVHYLEMPASLWGGTVSAPFIPHSFNGGRSHISRTSLSTFNFKFSAFNFQLSTLNFHPTLFQRGQQKSHFERAGLFSTVRFQMYLHCCFNGGSKSHISREASKSHHWNSAVSSIRELAVVVQTELVWRLCCYIWREIYFTNPCAVALSSHVYPFKRGALKYLLFWIAPSLYI